LKPEIWAKRFFQIGVRQGKTRGSSTGSRIARKSSAQIRTADAFSDKHQGCPQKDQARAVQQRSAMNSILLQCAKQNGEHW
jgi:hypothetical protein